MIGGSYVYSRASLHATVIETGRTYYDDVQSSRGLALAGGFDGRFKLTSRVFLVPTFRAFLILRSTEGSIGEQASGGPFAFSYGIGTRIAF